MKIGERLQTVTRIFLDTAPVIYYIEDDVRYAALMERVFERLEDNALTVVTSKEAVMQPDWSMVGWVGIGGPC